MQRPRNAMEIFKLLEKSNCKKCGEKTCMAFAGAVFLAHRRLDECPKLSQEALNQFAGKTPEHHDILEESSGDLLKKLKSDVAHLDLATAAERVGGRFVDNKLTLKVLGRDFSVDTGGNLFSEIHINHWVAVPFLDYILHCQGVPISGSWISFRELREGMERYPFFKKRCEEPMKRVADIYPELFDDIVHVFGGRRVDSRFQSDISVVLNPLPLVPVMICYWLPGEGMDSSLHVFFDKTADRNLDVESVFTLSTGLAQMFEKIALRHGLADAAS
ncbi:conserved hypothetical protein [uncultured Desulfobacterium sp.]|uniref:4Fe-4S domain-containing protein n=1 Tax=uncultured Desulfobacterium sp. TaxID=201089 RepID=A0A445MU49_9BACT|nr:conserved hypothetical protein [uncultured Desulfobacterium sp.]